MLKVNTRLSDEILARYGGFAYSTADDAQLLLLQGPAQAPALAQTIVLTAQTVQNIENCVEQNTILNLNLNLGLAFLRRLFTAVTAMGQVTGTVTGPQSPGLWPGQLTGRSVGLLPAARQETLPPRRTPAPEWGMPANLTPPGAGPLRPTFFHCPVLTSVPAGTPTVSMPLFIPGNKRAESVHPVHIHNLHTWPPSRTSAAEDPCGDRIFRVEGAVPLAAAPPEQTVRRISLNRDVPGMLSTAPLGQTAPPGFSASWPVPHISPIFQTELSLATQPTANGGLPEPIPFKPLITPAYLPASRTVPYFPQRKPPLDGTAMDMDFHRPGSVRAGSRQGSRTYTSAGERQTAVPHAAAPPMLAQMAVAIPVVAPLTFRQGGASPGPTEIKDAPGKMKQRLSVETPVEEGRRAAPVISALWPMPGAPLPIQGITSPARSPLPPARAIWPRIRTAGVMTAWTASFSERAYPPDGHVLFPPVTSQPAVSGHPPRPQAASRVSDPPVWEGTVPATSTGQTAGVPGLRLEPVLISRSPAGPAGWRGTFSPPAPLPEAASRIEGANTAQRTAFQSAPVSFASVPILLRAGPSASQPPEEPGGQADIPTVRTRRTAAQKTGQTVINRAINAPGASPPASAGQDLSRAVEEAVKNLDIKKLTERVYRDLETRLRLEQARRGR